MAGILAALLDLLDQISALVLVHPGARVGWLLYPHTLGLNMKEKLLSYLSQCSLGFLIYSPTLSLPRWGRVDYSQAWTCARPDGESGQGQYELKHQPCLPMSPKPALPVSALMGPKSFSLKVARSACCLTLTTVIPRSLEAALGGGTGHPICRGTCVNLGKASCVLGQSGRYPPPPFSSLLGSGLP